MSLSRLPAVLVCGFACSGALSGPVAAQTPPASGVVKPGQDRWPVKTASDKDAREVRSRPVKTTVASLLRLPRPADMPTDRSNPAYQEHRARPVETTIYTVEAEVTECKLMPDGDYRVVMRGESGETMALEMPKPDVKFVAASSRFAKQIKAARAQMETKAQPNVVFKPMPLKAFARITGIGYFGRAYRSAAAETAGQSPTGNLIQLHPVLNIEWLPGKPGSMSSGQIRRTVTPRSEPRS